MPDEDRERALRESDEVMETGKEGISEFRWRTKDGRIRWVNNFICPIFDDGDKILGLRGVALDVTNRKLAEEKASEAEAKDRAPWQVRFASNRAPGFLDEPAYDRQP